MISDGMNGDGRPFALGVCLGYQLAASVVLKQPKPSFLHAIHACIYIFESLTEIQTNRDSKPTSISCRLNVLLQKGRRGV